MTASARIIIYCTPSEKKAFTAHAKAAKEHVSTHGRKALLAFVTPKPVHLPHPSDI